MSLTVEEYVQLRNELDIVQWEEQDITKKLAANFIREGKDGIAAEILAYNQYVIEYAGQVKSDRKIALKFFEEKTRREAIVSETYENWNMPYKYIDEPKNKELKKDNNE